MKRSFNTMHQALPERRGPARRVLLRERYKDEQHPFSQSQSGQFILTGTVERLYKSIQPEHLDSFDGYVYIAGRY